MIARPHLGGLFRQRLLDRREVLLGTFIKTPAPQPIEIIGAAGFDFVLIDSEHAPFDRSALETALLAARAAQIPALVRVADRSPSGILATLDAGAAGVVVPHVNSADAARAVVDACRYAAARGFSNSPRAGGYGARGLWEYFDAADAEVSVIAMIEDPSGVEAVDEIVAVDGIDGLFIGRGDLAAAYKDRQPGSPLVAEATRRVFDAATRVGKPICLMPTGPDEAHTLRAQGASVFVLSSDQGFLRQAATEVLAASRKRLQGADISKN